MLQQPAYHYTSMRAYERMLLEGLLPRTPIQGQRFTFAFLDWTLSDWAKRPGGLWYKLLRHAIADKSVRARARDGRVVLLELLLRPDDRAGVVDYAHMISKRQDRISRYLGSQMPLFSYTGNHRLPEVIVPTTIPPDRIQPLFVARRESIEGKRQYRQLQRWGATPHRLS